MVFYTPRINFRPPEYDSKKFTILFDTIIATLSTLYKQEYFAPYYYLSRKNKWNS